jgi:uncharacterized protein
MSVPPPNALSARLARFVTKHAVVVLIVSLALTGASVVVLRTLKIQANLFALLPPSLPEVKKLQRIYDKTGGFGDLVIMAEGGTPEGADAYFADLLPAVNKLKWTKGADYRVDMEALKPYGPLYMDVQDLRKIHDRLQRRLELAVGADLDADEDDEKEPPPLSFDDITKKYEARAKARKYPFHSRDGKIRALRIYPPHMPTSNLVFGRKALDDVQRLVDQRQDLARKHGLKITVGGKFYTRVQDYDSIILDLKRSAFWGGLLIVLLLTLYFRHILAVPLLLIPLVMSMAWTFAFTKLTIGDLNMITAFLFVILLGLGIDFGIHLFARYRSERLGGREVEESIAVTLATTGRACRTAMVTTAAAFASLVITDFRGFSQFGYIAAVGVILAFGTMSVILPSLLALCERIGVLKFRVRAGDVISGDVRRTAPPSKRLRGMLAAGVVFGVGVAVVGGYSASSGRIGFEYDFEKLNTLPPDVVKVKNKVTKVFGRRVDAAVVFVDSMEEAAALKKVVLASMAKDKTPTIRRVLSLNDMLPQNQAAKLVWIGKIRKILKKRAVQKALEDLPKKQRERVVELEKKAVSKAMVYQQLPRQLRRPFLGKPGIPGTLLVIVPTRPPRDARYAAAFVADTREFKTAAHTYQPVSEGVIFSEVIRILLLDGRIAIGATLFTVLLLLLVDFRRVGLTLIAFTPLAVAVGWLLLTMATWPVDLNMYNLVVLPSLLGLGIDNSVHMTHRWKELGPGRMKDVVRGVMGPIAVSTLTTMIGFGGMMAAHQTGLRSLGVLAVLGMGFSLFTVFTLLPAVLICIDTRKAREAAQAATETGSGPDPDPDPDPDTGDSPAH